MALGVYRKVRRVKTFKTGYELGNAVLNVPTTMPGPLFTTKQLCWALHISSRRRVYDVLNILITFGWVQKAETQKCTYVSTHYCVAAHYVLTDVRPDVDRQCPTGQPFVAQPHAATQSREGGTCPNGLFAVSAGSRWVRGFTSRSSF